MIYDVPPVDHNMVHTPPHMIVTAQDTPKQPSINIDQFSQKLTRRASYRSTSQCAKYVRIALQAAGADIKQHPVAAADWGKTLQKIGYHQIEPAFDDPQAGDIYIIDRTPKHRYGHIAGFTGSQWVSDFKQNSYAVYQDKNVTYTYYRLDNSI